MGGCQTTHEVYNEAFLAGTPDIAAEINDASFKMPMWLSDLWTLKRWEANDNVMQQLTFRGSQPEVERGFDRWKKLSSSAGCDPCANDCSYNYTTFTGHGFSRQLVALMRREFKTPDYCVNEIKSAHEFAQTFGKIIQNIQEQTAFFKEYNIGLNFLTGIAKKLVVDSTGIRGNRADPYSYPALGTARLSSPNTFIFTRLYEQLRRRTDVAPFDVVNGRPLYAVSMSDELIDQMYLNDPALRRTLEYSSAADAILTKYNFMESIRGMFLNAPLLYPRRFEYDTVNSIWIEVYPFVNGIPAEVGSFSDLNPAWENASYEEALVYGKEPFSVYYRDQLTTIGAGSEFGPEPSFMNQWLWINIQTECDEFRRSGHYSTAIEIALAAQYSGGVFGIMFPRLGNNRLATFYAEPTALPTPVTVNNAIPAAGCPCPLILSAQPSPFTAGLYTLQFGTAVAGTIGGTVNMGLDTGLPLTGTLAALSADGYFAQIQFSAGLVLPGCHRFTSVYCTDVSYCDSRVLSSCDCRAGEVVGFTLVLERSIKAETAGDTIAAFMGDGTVQNLVVVSVNVPTNTWTVKYATGFGPTDAPTGGGAGRNNAGVNCDRNGVVRVCVLPATDASCPGCTAPALSSCVEA